MGRLKAIPAEAAPPRRQPARRSLLACFLAPVRTPVAAAFAAVALAFVVGLATPSPFGGDAAAPTVLAVTDQAGEEPALAADDGEVAIVDAWFGDETAADQEEPAAADDEDMELAILDLALD